MSDKPFVPGSGRKKPSNLAIRGLNPPKEKVEETTCAAANGPYGARRGLNLA